MSEERQSLGAANKGLRRAKLERVKEFLLQHPRARDLDVIEQFDASVSRRLIAYARADLVERGLLPPPRKKVPGSGRKRKEPVLDSTGHADAGTAEAKEAGLAPSAPTDYSNQLLTPDTVAALASVEDVSDIESDIEAQRRMLREAKRMAFDSKLHPDTRMSAMQLWVKLKDALKSRELGPGKPLNYEAARARGRDLFQAMGMTLVLHVAIDLWGQAFVQKLIELFGGEDASGATNDETPSVAGAEGDAVPAGHEDPEAEAEVVRAEHVGGRGDGQREEDLEHQDPAGPAT